MHNSIRESTMIDIKFLANEAIKLLDDHKKDNYRVCIVIAGPPGSGKSTIAGKLCSEVNVQYEKYVQRQGGAMLDGTAPESITRDIDIVPNVPEMPASLVKEMKSNGGILPEFVEDTEFQPVKRCLANGEVQVIGRGGLPNAFAISSNMDDSHRGRMAVAEMVPMDGFHLNRQCLKCFQNPEEAVKRRGSPPTFDSNNFVQLCKTLAQSCAVKPRDCNASQCFEFISKTYNPQFPCIRIPGFDHSLKDPTPNQYRIDGCTRIVVLEGLYLLYDKENWKKIHQVLQETGAYELWYIDIEDNIIEERVAQRHLKSGLVDTLEQGRLKFEANDLLNARLIRQNMVQSDEIAIWRND